MESKIDIAAELRAHVAKEYKTRKSAAEAWGVSPHYVGRLLEGKAQPTDTILALAGFTRTVEPARVYYHKIKEKK